MTTVNPSSMRCLDARALFADCECSYGLHCFKSLGIVFALVIPPLCQKLRLFSSLVLLERGAHYALLHGKLETHKAKPVTADSLPPL